VVHCLTKSQILSGYITSIDNYFVNMSVNLNPEADEIFA
jgi:hypothetical protein